MISSRPLVSICCLTYNQSNYIEKALDSFLEQITSFAFEIIIHDDASTDGTSLIVKNYAEKYPNYIRALFEVENQWEKGKHGLETLNLENAKGEYIAFCEGDDYWTDPHKLQKQVDFMENHPEIGLTHSDCNMVDSSGDILVNRYFYYQGVNIISESDSNLVFDSLISGKYKVCTPTVLFRHDLYMTISEKLNSISAKYLMGDIQMWLYMSKATKFHYMNEVFAAYRKSDNSVTRSCNRNQKFRFSLSMYEVRISIMMEYNKPITDILKTKYNNSLINYKLHVNSYKAMHPLIRPSILQKMQYQCLNYNILRHIIKVKFLLARIFARIHFIYK